jgi:hypothetical protein
MPFDIATPASGTLPAAVPDPLAFCELIEHPDQAPEMAGSDASAARENSPHYSQDHGA